MSRETGDLRDLTQILRRMGVAGVDYDPYQGSIFIFDEAAAEAADRYAGMIAGDSDGDGWRAEHYPDLASAGEDGGAAPENAAVMPLAGRMDEVAVWLYRQAAGFGYAPVKGPAEIWPAYGRARREYLESEEARKAHLAAIDEADSTARYAETDGPVMP
jgi:hypothetical protein